MSASSKDYAKPLTIEKAIADDDYGMPIALATRLQADQGHALRMTIAAAAGEIVQAIDELRIRLTDRP